jgi:hypothetical protein
VSCPESYSPHSDAAQRFAAAIEAYHGASRKDATDVQDAACAYVAELKAQAWPPERVLIQIKELLRTSSGRSDDEQQRHLLQRVITWCIEAYYRGS